MLRRKSFSEKLKGPRPRSTSSSSGKGPGVAGGLLFIGAAIAGTKAFKRTSLVTRPKSYPKGILKFRKFKKDGVAQS